MPFQSDSFKPQISDLNVKFIIHIIFHLANLHSKKICVIMLILHSMIFTDDIIKELINCPKKVVDAPKDSGVGRGSRKIKFSLESVDGKHSFNGFISKNMTFQENYSI